MTQTQQFSVELTTVNCGVCGGVYALNERYRQQKQQEGTCWTCPYCQTGWGYAGNGENDRLKKELAQERQKRDQAEAKARESEIKARQAELRSQKSKAETTRVKKRAKAGVCPCCHRTFKQLAAHMESKHPQFATGEPAV